MANTTVSIDQLSVNQVKGVIIGTSFTIGSYYEQAALEKIERDKLQEAEKTEPKSY